ncbi:MAG: hypothetical protein WBF93_13220 [Pirellulales bacterium]
MNIVTGKYRAAGVDLAQHPPFFRRPYVALHRGIFFNGVPFARYKVAERWLEKMTRNWNSAHPERTVIESVLLHASIKSSDLPIRPERLAVVAEWKSGDS